jgi:hypothetical protein
MIRRCRERAPNADYFRNGSFSTEGAGCVCRSISALPRKRPTSARQQKDVLGHEWEPYSIVFALLDVTAYTKRKAACVATSGPPKSGE